ncbi:rhodanese-like domain-containing protein [Edaphobacter sp. HDX4]|uniref:rhodanese-like domain-containing protein n=1 Tax=Edaphobacter sp. HDX4 TaxID=2794064 RepID=UPI002FE5B605
MMAILIDVREYPEFANGHIHDAQLVPLGTIEQASEAWDKSAPIMLVCKSGRRAEQARKLLAAKGFEALSVMPGGMDGWAAEGKPMVKAAHRPWAMERQVRTVAGSLVVATLALGVTKSRYFLIATGLVGAGLVFAGVSNTCMMASALARMPWNRPAKGR